MQRDRSLQHREHARSQGPRHDHYDMSGEVFRRGPETTTTWFPRGGQRAECPGALHNDHNDHYDMAGEVFRRVPETTTTWLPRGGQRTERPCAPRNDPPRNDHYDMSGEIFGRHYDMSGEVSRRDHETTPTWLPRGGQRTKCPCAFRSDHNDHCDNKDATTTMAAVTVSANLLRTGLERSSDTRLFVQTYWDSTATDLGEDAHDAVPFWLSLDTGTVWLSILELSTPRLTTIVLD